MIPFVSNGYLFGVVVFNQFFDVILGLLSLSGIDGGTWELNPPFQVWSTQQGICTLRLFKCQLPRATVPVRCKNDLVITACSIRTYIASCRINPLDASERRLKFML